MIENSDFLMGADAAEVASALSSCLEERRFADFRLLTETIAPVDLALVFEECPESLRPAFFRLLSKEKAAECFVELSPEHRLALVESFTDRELSDLLSELYIDDTVDLVEEMPASLVKRILRASNKEDRDGINRILNYPKDSAGAIMTTEYMRLRADMTVKEALVHIRSVALDKETIYTCYITDDARHLIGVVSAKKLLISELDTRVSEIMETGVISAQTTDDSENVAEKLARYGLIALPVVDREMCLVGIVTVDDAMEVLRREREEDFAKMAAITPSERPYIKTSPFALFRARIPWLLLLMVSATLSSTILNRFEALLPTVLVLFVPMLMDTGGNSGSQASVTMIRGLSLGEVRFADVIRVIWKEIRVGVLCSVVLGIVALGKVMLVDRLIMQNSSVTFGIAAVVALTLAITVIMSKLIGATLPMLASRIGLDPAVMASPFITTIVDALALIVYFFMAQGFLTFVNK